MVRASNASDASEGYTRTKRLQAQKESAVRLASAAMASVDEDGEVTVPSSISQEHRELFARAQRWVTMSDDDIQVSFSAFLVANDVLCAPLQQSSELVSPA